MILASDLPVILLVILVILRVILVMILASHTAGNTSNDSTPRAPPDLLAAGGGTSGSSLSMKLAEGWLEHHTSPRVV